MNEISQKIRDNTNLYESYSKSDHSDIGSHTHVFPSFNLGDDYIAYIGMNWPEMKEFLIPCLTKEFILEDGGDDMTLGMIYPDNLEGKIPFFSQRYFLRISLILQNSGKISSSWIFVRMGTSSNPIQGK